MPTSRMEQLQALLNESPEDSFLLFAIAKEYEKQEAWESARKHYEKLLEADPEYLGVYYHLGKLLEYLEGPKKAWQTYTRGMELARLQGDQHALSELAGARLALGEEEDFE